MCMLEVNKFLIKKNICSEATLSLKNSQVWKGQVIEPKGRAEQVEIDVTVDTNRVE